MQIFRVKSVKFTPAKKNLHGYTRGSRDKYEVCLSTQPIYLEILRQRCCSSWWGQSTFMIEGSRDKLSLWVLVVCPWLHKTQSAGAGFKPENRGQKAPSQNTDTKIRPAGQKQESIASLSVETRTFIETDTESFFETNILRPIFWDRDFFF